MKKKNMIVLAVAALMMAGCGNLGGTGTGMDGILNGVDGASVLGNVLGGLLGTNKVTEQNLVGTWKYSSPGCAFTSQNVLAQLGVRWLHKRWRVSWCRHTRLWASIRPIPTSLSTRIRLSLEK